MGREHIEVGAIGCVERRHREEQHASYTQTYEAEVLFGRLSAQEAGEKWVEALTADIEAAR